MISAEISQVQSWQQDDEGVTLQNTTNVLDLEEQANRTRHQIELFSTLLVDLYEISINCGNEVKINHNL